MNYRWSSVFNFHIREQYFHVNCRFLIIMNWEIFVGSQIYHWVAVQFSFSKRKKLHFSLVAREDTKSKRGWEDGFIDLDHLHGETKCKIIKAHLLKISLEFWLFYFFENWIVFLKCLLSQINRYIRNLQCHWYTTPRATFLDHLHACMYFSVCSWLPQVTSNGTNLFFKKKKMTRAYLVVFIHCSGVKNFLVVAWIWSLKVIDVWNMEHILFGAFIFLKSFVNITSSPNLDA